jgi:cell division protein FtsZ
VEAAMAAMASPLLESGAIDGARGILINITGSSSLKLSEVNEASTIIQNAAHEDANIIFGAVQDETMGDEVKITVIATGFKQQEMPERRERMLAEATLPTMRYEVPIETRTVSHRTHAAPISTPQSTVSMPKFQSDVEVKPAPLERREMPAQDGAELLPVPASVFDDDFFRSSPPRVAPSHLPDESVRVEAGVREPAYFQTVESVQLEGSASDPGPRAPFSGATVENTEPDELDIPAFLRRGH